MIWLMDKITESDKNFTDKAFKIASNLKYDGYERELVSVVYKFFDKKSASIGAKSIPNQQLADVIHKPVFRKFKRSKVYCCFKDNIWGPDFADMQ